MALEILEQIEQLKAQLAVLPPIDELNAQRLYKKFRLEWNYNSNHIEGNTLTYGETELLLLFGETRGSHDFREYEEMKGHDVALKMVEELARDKERDLTETFIRDLNKVILKEPFYKEAQTADGQFTRRLIVIGKYKEYPNSVRLQNGEMFHYASPAETPIKMMELVDWYRSASTNPDLHPVVVAAELHYRFVRIHPFDDGNGRISRLLMNYHLLRNDYPPIIIKSTDKQNYLRALHDADTGNIPAFVEYIAQQLLWSYEMSIKAAKGESIDEPDDWEKEIELLKRNIHPSRIANQEKSEENLRLIWEKSLSYFIENLIKSLKKVDELFAHNDVAVFVNDKGILPAMQDDTLNVKNTLTDIFVYPNIVFKNELPKKLNLKFYWDGYRYDGTNTFGAWRDVSIIFELQKYTIEFSLDGPIRKQLLYNQFLSESESQLLIKQIREHLLSEIKKRKTS